MFPALGAEQVRAQELRRLQRQAHAIANDRVRLPQNSYLEKSVIADKSTWMQGSRDDLGFEAPSRKWVHHYLTERASTYGQGPRQYYASVSRSIQSFRDARSKPDPLSGRHTVWSRKSAGNRYRKSDHRGNCGPGSRPGSSNRSLSIARVFSDQESAVAAVIQIYGRTAQLIHQGQLSAPSRC